MSKSLRDEYAEKHGEKAAGRVDQALLAEITRAAASMLRAAIKEGGPGMEKEIGFTLVMFTFGDEPGAMAYASTANRADFLRLLDELRGKLAAVVPDAPAGH